MGRNIQRPIDVASSDRADRKACSCEIPDDDLNAVAGGLESICSSVAPSAIDECRFEPISPTISNSGICNDAICSKRI